MDKNHTLYSNRDKESEEDYIERIFSKYPNIEEEILKFIYKHLSFPEIIGIFENLDLS